MPLYGEGGGGEGGGGEGGEGGGGEGGGYKAQPVAAHSRLLCYRGTPRGFTYVLEGCCFGDLQMKIKAGKEAHWAERVRVNSHPYSACIIRYAEKWADLMETRIENGERLSQIAKECSHEADTEGITGFMYGAAAAELSDAWEHGEELRQWHNLDAQIGTEGEEANKSGGVLNPALLNFEVEP